MSQLIRFLLSFFMIYAVDPGDQGSVLDEGDDGKTDGVDEGGETVDAGEAAWEALQGEDDGADAVDGEPDQGNSSGDDAESAEGKGSEKAAENAEAKDKPDTAITEDDLKPLEGAKAKTQERFQKVTEGYKAEKERADKLAQEVTNYKQSFDSLRQLGFNDEAAANDLVEFSAYRGVLASGDVQKFSEIISAQIKQFQELHGKQVTVSGSILSDHSDLQTKVENMELDEPTAIEVARTRNIQARAQREAERNQLNSQEQQRSVQAINDGASAVAALENEWRNNDSDFPVILPLLKEQLPEIAKSFPPQQWGAQFKIQYQAIKKAMAMAGSNNNQTSPLRGGNHMSASRQPSNLVEAVLFDMDME